MDELIIQPINPIYFSGGLPDYYYYSHNPIDCYAQKFENDDTTKVQVLSEDAISAFTLIRAKDNKAMRSYAVNQIGTVKDSDLDIYEIPVEFDNLDEDMYYFRLASGGKERFSELIAVAEKWEKTLWIEYNNSEDHDGVKFDNGNFGVRVEGTLQEFQPDSDSNIYDDTNKRPTTLKSTPFRMFTLYIGNSDGLPDFMLDMVNRIFTCDYTTIDGRLFNKTDDSEWEFERIVENPFAGMHMMIQAIDPVQRMIFLSDEEDDENVRTVMFRKAYKAEGMGDDFSVSGVIESKTLLDYISVFPNGSSPYTLKVGTTNGGNDILETEITEDSETLQVRLAYATAKTLYFTGVTSGNQDFYIVYERLNKEISVDNAEAETTDFMKYMTVLFDGTPEQLTAAFNLNTGLGRNDWEGWAICDGRNGTIDRRDTFPYGWDLNTGNAGDTVGSNTVSISEQNLPKITPKWKFTQGQKNDVFQGRDGNIYSVQPTISKSPIAIDRNPIESFGGNQPMDIRPKRVLTVFVQKIN